MGSSDLAWDFHGSPCVHCGLCLDACPTYRVNGLEAESPRGRLYLMEAVADGRIALDHDVAGHLDSCLGCLACETACPSGVKYGRRIEGFRPRLHGGVASRPRHAWRMLVHRALRSDRWQRLALVTARMADRTGLARLRRQLPGLSLVPAHTARASPTRSDRSASDGRPPRARVALLMGCGARVFRPELEAAVRSVLAENEIDVETMDAGICCGALSLHDGRTAEATHLASDLVRRFADAPVDYIVTVAAGCRAALGDADHLADAVLRLSGDSARLASKSREICELLVELGFRAPRGAGRTAHTIGYHDACHLLHAARVAQPARDVLTATGAVVVDLGENAVCCGSAGTYNLVHPRTASELGRRKAELVAAGAFRQVAVANLGCILQIERALDIASAGLVRVAHPIEYLAEAYERERWSR